MAEAALPEQSNVGSTHFPTDILDVEETIARGEEAAGAHMI